VDVVVRPSAGAGGCLGRKLIKQGLRKESHSSVF
jgi:hypothetical protein